MRRAWLVALLAGGATVFAFAPFGLFALAFPGLGVLVWLLAGAARAREGFVLGGLHGLVDEHRVVPEELRRAERRRAEQLQCA